MKKLKLRKNITLGKPAVPDVMRRINKDLQKPGDMGRAIPAPIKGTTKQTSADGRTEIYTRITDSTGETKLLYSAETWVRIQLLLETAGPVEVSTRDQIGPLLSGNGIPLETGVLYNFIMPRGNRMWIASSAVNRVQFIVSPFPWLESISQTLLDGFRGLLRR